MARYFSGQRLREARKAAGISIARLAISVDRSAYTIQEYQRGRITPPIDVLTTMADVLGRPIEALLVDEEVHAVPGAAA